jgi:4-hydroxybenzoate polyprenyltransferase
MTTQATRKAPGKLRTFLRARKTRATPTEPGQPRSFLRAMHPRQALALAVVVGLFVYLMGRPAREVLIAAAAVLVAQLVMGLANDLSDAEADRRSGASGKPVAEGIIPPGNVSYVIAMLVLIAIPLSLQNGILAGLFLLGTLVVGFVHNRWLHRTVLSWVGWSATFALLAYFVTYGGWSKDADGSAPLPSFVILSALLGLLVHFLTSLPDLVEDNKSGSRHLPLRVALKTGAPRLLVVTLVATVVVVALFIYKALSVGIAY